LVFVESSEDSIITFLDYRVALRVSEVRHAVKRPEDAMLP